MTHLRHIIRSAAAMVAISLLAACSEAEPTGPVVKEGQIIYPAIRGSVIEMTMTGISRAAEPMTIDKENYIKTAALFEFDNEGLHTKSPTTYHYIDFTKGTVDGEINPYDDVSEAKDGITDFMLTGLAFESRSNGILCLVANVTEDSVKAFYRNYRDEGQSYGNITFEQFKRWSLPFDYEKSPSGLAYDESVSGYLKSMYMFGYYQGVINASKPGDLSIDIGRLASRLTITIINETGRELDKQLGYHFDNVCRSAYFFPLKMSPPPTIGAGTSRTIICTGDTPVEDAPNLPRTFAAGEQHTRYFYCAAHSAKSMSQATQLHLFYNSQVLESEFVQEGGQEIKIPMCSVNPTIAAGVENGFSLSRNTAYHFIIRLRSADAAAKASMTRSSANPDDIIVYLPDL